LIFYIICYTLTIFFDFLLVAMSVLALDE
jgi:hypothetical protein